MMIMMVLIQMPSDSWRTIVRNRRRTDIFRWSMSWEDTSIQVFAPPAPPPFNVEEIVSPGLRTFVRKKPAHMLTTLNIGGAGGKWTCSYWNKRLFITVANFGRTTVAFSIFVTQPHDEMPNNHVFEKSRKRQEELETDGPVGFQLSPVAIALSRWIYVFVYMSVYI